MKFKIPRSSGGECTTNKTLELGTLFVDGAIAVEPLDNKITKGKSSWPVERNGTLPDGKNPTPSEQKWTLLIGEKGKGTFTFSFVGRKLPKSNGSLKFDLFLRCESEDRQSIEDKEEVVKGKKKEIGDTRSELETARNARGKEREKADLQIKVNKLEGELRTFGR